MGSMSWVLKINNRSQMFVSEAALNTTKEFSALTRSSMNIHQVPSKNTRREEKSNVPGKKWQEKELFEAQLA